MPKWILVTGSARRADTEAHRRAHIVGRELARAGFGLVVGTWPGVDVQAADAFLSELRALGKDPAHFFRQVRAPYWKRRSMLLLRYFPRHRGSGASVVNVNNKSEYNIKTAEISDAAILIGGYGGMLLAARSFIAAGKPVFPIPFSGGDSDRIFQELLRNWHDNPIPGLTRSQVLRLALPWVSGANQLIELLQGTLSETADIFISYRRTDSGAAVGRLQHDLGEYFGARRIFVDETRIEPSAIWRASIEKALSECKVGLIVIGPRWLNDKLARDNDVLRWEVSSLLAKKVTLPILVDDATLPKAAQLPPGLERLPSIQATPINNVTWEVTVAALIKVIEGILRRPQ